MVCSGTIPSSVLGKPYSEEDHKSSIQSMAYLSSHTFHFSKEIYGVNNLFMLISNLSNGALPCFLDLSNLNKILVGIKLI